MAEGFKPFFNVSADKIFATLHLAGQQQVTAKPQILINTAIKNPVDKADPSNLGSVEFDLSNKSGEYQVGAGCIASWLLPLDIENLKDYKILIEAYNKAKSDAEKAKKKDKNKSLTAPADGESEAVSEDVKKAQDNLLAYFKSFKLKEYKENKDSYEESAKSFTEAVKAENEEREKKKQDAFKLAIKNGTKYLKEYFTTFAGKEKANSINESNVVLMKGDIDGKLSKITDFKYVKDFKINTAEIDEECKKTEQEHQQKEPQKPFTRTMLCVVGYSVNQDTM